MASSLFRHHFFSVATGPRQQGTEAAGPTVARGCARNPEVLRHEGTLNGDGFLSTLPETIMEVEHRPLEDYFLLQVRPAQLP